MGQSTRRLSGLPIDLQGNVNPGHPFDRGARFELLIECMASNREVMARSGFMEVESSPLALQARGPETAFWELTDEKGGLRSCFSKSRGEADSLLALEIQIFRGGQRLYSRTS
jgi:hypothetical protein